MRERLCILWGDLEEQKSALSRANDAKMKPSSVYLNSTPHSSYIPGELPPLSSDDEQENKDKEKCFRSGSSQSITALSERDPNPSITGREKASSDSNPSAHIRFKNKAFTCCIKQYGVQISKNPALANAGDGIRWERKFGLFGTMIV